MISSFERMIENEVKENFLFYFIIIIFFLFQIKVVGESVNLRE